MSRWAIFEIPCCTLFDRSSIHISSIVHTPVAMNKMIQVLRISALNPYKAPALHVRPGYDAVDLWVVVELWNAAGKPWSRAIHPLEMFMQSWNEWADEVDTIFRQMVDQTTSLDVSHGGYMHFLGIISTHPPRPYLSSSGGSQKFCSLTRWKRTTKVWLVSLRATICVLTATKTRVCQVYRCLLTHRCGAICTRSRYPCLAPRDLSAPLKGPRKGSMRMN